MLAVEAVGHSVTTIEGLKNAPTQKAFFEKWGFQCGCLHIRIYHGHALTHTIHPGADDDTIADWLQSNICRCTSYEEIANAVKQVLKKDI